MSGKAYKKLIPAIGVGLLGAAAAPNCEAALVNVTATVTNMGVPRYSAADSTLLTGYHAYKVDVTTNSGVITGVDVASDTTKQFTVPLHQVWSLLVTKSGNVFTPSPTGPAPTSVGGNPVSWDSYLVMPAGFLAVTDPTEDNSGTGSPWSSSNGPSGDWYGMGTFLKTAYGITSGQAATMTIAYLVIPDTAVVGGALHLGTAQVSVGVDQYNVSMDIGAPIPEPGSLGMVVFGGLGFLIRRRRTA